MFDGGATVADLYHLPVVLTVGKQRFSLWADEADSKPCLRLRPGLEQCDCLGGGGKRL